MRPMRCRNAGRSRPCAVLLSFLVLTGCGAETDNPAPVDPQSAALRTIVDALGNVDQLSDQEAVRIDGLLHEYAFAIPHTRLHERSNDYLLKLAESAAQDPVRRGTVRGLLSPRRMQPMTPAQAERWDLLMKGAAQSDSPRVSGTGCSTVGTWRDNQPIGRVTMTIVKCGSSVRLDREWPGGEKSTSALVETTSPNGRRFNKSPPGMDGDYFLLRPSGTLEIRDRDGLIATAQPVR
jgi:hypothetical protein